MGDKSNKKTVAAVRGLLFVLGALLGWLIMSQILWAFPGLVEGWMKLAVLTSGALLLGAVLMLSARPFMYITGRLFAVFKKLIREKRPIEIAGIFFGVILGLMIAYLAYSLLSLFINIIALNVLITVIVALAACSLGALGCSNWLKAEPDDEESEDLVYFGYVADASAFSSGLLRPLLTEWIAAKAAVLSVTVEKLIDGAQIQSNQTEENEKPGNQIGCGAEALLNYRKLSGEGALKLCECGEAESEAEAVKAYAEAKRLKIITADKSAYDGCAAPVLDITSI